MAVNMFHTLPEGCIAAMCACFRYPDANGNGEARVVCAFALPGRRVDVKQELLETMRVVMGLRIEAAVEQNLPCTVHIKYLAVPGVWDELVELQLLGVDVSQPQDAGPMWDYPKGHRVYRLQADIATRSPTTGRSPISVHSSGSEASGGVSLAHGNRSGWAESDVGEFDEI